MIIGSHVSFSSEQLLGSVKEALSYGANTFMFYTGAPQNTLRKEIDADLTTQAKDLMKENNIDITKVVCHAPYIINLANKQDLNRWQFSIDFLKQELRRCDALGISYLVLHPGSAVVYTKEEALENIIEALNQVFEENFNCQILLETMAGKGTECGSYLEEIAYLLEHTHQKMSVCIDTCHLNDAGYDMQKFDEFLDEFAEVIGLEKIKCVHVNDSKNERSTHKDRHANIGYGTIGFEALSYICHHDKLKDVPKILETPYVGMTWTDKKRLYPPYKYEIKMLKENTFDPQLLEHILTDYKR